jgi:hypothetical protein
MSRSLSATVPEHGLTTDIGTEFFVLFSLMTIPGLALVGAALFSQPIGLCGHRHGK